MYVALIITTYNWPEALKVTLHSVLRQSRPPEEIIVADDGSGPDTAKVVEGALIPSGLKWCHVRHHDKGIRQARVKNLAVRYSRAAYLIFIDHDVIIHSEFIADHLVMVEEGHFLQGKRCFLPKHYTEKILAGGSFTSCFALMRGVKNRKNACRFPKLGRTLSRSKGFQSSLRGCNLSMHKQDFLRVDGFDETFDQLWGREDSDICYRLFHSGIRIKNLWFLALQYHLYHEVAKNREKDRLDRELDRIIEEKRVKALNGFSQLSPEGEVIAVSGGF
jgi:glycosyltransferase involved in cell wall biosynthesis